MKSPRASTIRASEIGTFLFCRRAWWYQMKGETPSNQEELQAGTEIHQQHGRSVLTAALYRGLGYLFLLLALIFGTLVVMDRLL